LPNSAAINVFAYSVAPVPRSISKRSPAALTSSTDVVFPP